MSVEIQLPFAGGHTLYAVVRGSAASVVGTAPVVEQGDSGWYVGDLPSPLAAGTYTATAYLQRGGDPDPTDPGVWYVELDWDGTKVVELTPEAVAAVVVQAIYPLADGTLGRQAGDVYTVYRGEDAALLVTLPGAYPVDAATLVFSVTAKLGTYPPVLTVGDGTGLTVVDADARQIKVTFPVALPAQKSDDLSSAYYWDVWSTVSGHKTSVRAGRLRVLPPVRQPDPVPG